jgi:hypothetical protein
VDALPVLALLGRFPQERMELVIHAIVGQLAGGPYLSLSSHGSAFFTFRPIDETETSPTSALTIDTMGSKDAFPLPA